MPARRIWTLGHSTHSIEHFATLLKAHGIRELVDVRRWPMSRRNPQFNADVLAQALAWEGVSYRHSPDLGGRRTPLPESPNKALKSDQFRGYADHMASLEFAVALEGIVSLAAEAPTAIMCAEAVPFRCHRSLLSDALTAYGVEVLHIIDVRPAKPHQLSPYARIEDGAVTYPALL